MGETYQKLVIGRGADVIDVLGALAPVLREDGGYREIEHAGIPLWDYGYLAMPRVRAPLLSLEAVSEPDVTLHTFGVHYWWKPALGEVAAQIDLPKAKRLGATHFELLPVRAGELPAEGLHFVWIAEGEDGALRVQPATAGNPAPEGIGRLREKLHLGFVTLLRVAATATPA